jgi:uncharacterized protein YutE (UPF0331/DUF86 family)
MNKSNTQREARKIRELARVYEKKGFSVSISPKDTAIPAFLRQMNYVPDLVVKSEKESFVIEVSSSDTAERLREISKIVSTIEKKRGWDFILVMTNPRSLSDDRKVIEPPSVEELHESFMKVKALSNISSESRDDFSHAILLSAWAVVEGALRMYLNSNTPEKLGRSPRSIVRDAVMYGYITANEGSFLDSVAELRNVIAHGTSTRHISSSMIKKLLTLCESLVTIIEPKNKNA